MDRADNRDGAIASLLWYGTWIASAVIALGVVIKAIRPDAHGLDLVNTGIVLFILLPVARVMLLLLMFLRARDFVYSAISATVLAVIAAGVVIGLR